MEDIIKIKDIDFKYSGVKYDYSSFTQCDGGDCCGDSICRCGTIVDTKIVSVDVYNVASEIYSRMFDKNDLASKRDTKINSILFGTGKELDIYSIDRILRCHKIWNNSFEVCVVSGYYGEEIGDVSFFDYTVADKIESEIYTALGKDTIKSRMEYLLGMEYGYLLPELDECDYELISIDIDDVVFGSDSHYVNIQKENLDHYRNYNGIKGVVKKDGEKYKIIDGYHRIHSTKLTSKYDLKIKSGNCKDSNIIQVILARK